MATGKKEAAKGKPDMVSMEVLKDLVHDLRNPLVAALGFVNLLERAEPGPATQRYTAALKESMESLKQILDSARKIYGGIDHS